MYFLSLKVESGINFISTKNNAAKKESGRVTVDTSGDVYKELKAAAMDVSEALKSNVTKKNLVPHVNNMLDLLQEMFSTILEESEEGSDDDDDDDL